MSAESEQDLFGEGPRDGQAIHGQIFEVANEAERFLGPLRSGMCGWDAGSALWVAPFHSLALVGRALALASLAESGELCATQLFIAPKAEGLADWSSILGNRASQLLALGLELEWTSPGSCLVRYAPEGFDNCDWGQSLAALGKTLGASKTDALSLSISLCSGLDLPALGSDELWLAADRWMKERRLARELPGARMIALA